MRPEVRPRKLTRRSASPSGKVLRIMASVSRAGMRNVGAPTLRSEAGRNATTGFHAKRAHVQDFISYHTRTRIAMRRWRNLWRNGERSSANVGAPTKTAPFRVAFAGVLTELRPSERSPRSEESLLDVSPKEQSDSSGLRRPRKDGLSQSADRKCRCADIFGI